MSPITACDIAKKVDELTPTEDRWRKGGLGDIGNPTAPHCLMGKVTVAERVLNANPMQGVEYACVLRSTIRELYGPRGLVGFNDNRGTTFADIRRVIEVTRAKLCGPDG